MLGKKRKNDDDDDNNEEETGADNTSSTSLNSASKKIKTGMASNSSGAAPVSPSRTRWNSAIRSVLKNTKIKRFIKNVLDAVAEFKEMADEMHKLNDIVLADRVFELQERYDEFTDSETTDFVAFLQQQFPSSISRSSSEEIEEIDDEYDEVEIDIAMVPTQRLLTMTDVDEYSQEIFGSEDESEKKDPATILPGKERNEKEKKGKKKKMRKTKEKKEATPQSQKNRELNQAEVAKEIISSQWYCGACWKEDKVETCIDITSSTFKACSTCEHKQPRKDGNKWICPWCKEEVDLTNKRKDCMNNWDGTTNIKCRHLKPRTQSKNMTPLFKMYFNRQTGMYSVSRPKQEKKAKKKTDKTPKEMKVTKTDTKGKFYCLLGCGNSFSSVSNRNSHHKMRCDLGKKEKKFKCGFCTKEYKRETELRTHHLKHHFKGERTFYYCPVATCKKSAPCGFINSEGFETTSTLRKHIKANHPEVPLVDKRYRNNNKTEEKKTICKKCTDNDAELGGSDYNNNNL